MNIEPTPLVIDTDAGIDDAAAVWWAVTQPDVEVLAITIVKGNVNIAQAVSNVRTILRASGRVDIPIVVGADGPMGPTPALRPADFIHGLDGLGGFGSAPEPEPTTGPTVAELFETLTMSNSAPLTVVSLGPLTNLGHLVRDRPELVGRINRWVAMGGAVTVPGNAQPLAEANIAHDPLAAQTAIEGRWRHPPLFVGLDVTHQATITSAELSLLDEIRTPAAAFLQGPLDFYRRHAGTFCAPGEFPCHDLLAVMAAVHGLVDGPVLPTAVQTTPGPAWGALVPDRRVPFFERAGSGSAQATPEGMAVCQIGLEVDVDGFRHRLRALFGG